MRRLCGNCEQPILQPPVSRVHAKGLAAAQRWIPNQVLNEDIEALFLFLSSKSTLQILVRCQKKPIAKKFFLTLCIALMTWGMDFYEWWFIYYEWFLFLVFLGAQLLLSENAHGEDDSLDLVLKLNSFVTISELISGSQFFLVFFCFPFLKMMLWERESWNKIFIPSSTNFLKNFVIYTVIKRYALICFCR